jgi:hypothetical protein
MAIPQGSDINTIAQQLYDIIYPVGSILMYFGVSDPTNNFLICDGSTIGSDASAATKAGSEYKRLYMHLWLMVTANSASLTISGGAGSDAQADWTANKTITLPDMRALVARGLGTQTINARTKTGQSNLGDKQEDQIQGHWHNIFAVVNPPGFAGGFGDVALTNASGVAVSNRVATPVSDGTNGSPRFGSETQQSSIGINYIIKV